MAKLKTFRYHGTNKLGGTVSGVIEATDIDTAQHLLLQKGILVTRLYSPTKPLQHYFHRITATELCQITTQLATLLQAGLPLLQALSLTGNHSHNPHLTQLLHTIRKEVSAGNALSAILRQQPDYFSTLFCDLVHAGELSGNLENSLVLLATYQEKTLTLRKRIVKALLYPAAIIAVAIIVTVILLLFVVPQFALLFAGFGAELPWFTRQIMTLSDGLVKYGSVMLATFIAGVLLLKYRYHKHAATRHYIDHYLLKMPLAGKVLHKMALVRCCQTLATTLSAGVALKEALQASAGASGNAVLQAAIRQISQKVHQGENISQAMAAYPLFPPLMIQLIATGEQSGKLDSMLLKAADIYQQEADDIIDNMAALAEPFIMVIMGLLIGSLIIAMYLPVFRFSAVIG